MNLFNSFQVRLLTIVSILILASCKKKDEVPPIMSLTSPGLNSQYYASDDFILCSGTVSDDVELDRVEFQLRTMTNSPAMGKRVVFLSQNPTTFNFGYFLDDIHLNSGSYRMKIEVFDKSGNSSSNYVEVIVFGVPRAKQGVFYVSESAGSYTLGKIDSLDLDSAAVGVFNDYAGFELNNYDQLAYFMGYESEDLIAFNSRSYSVNWSMNNLANPPGTYYFNQLNYSEDRSLIVSLYQDDALKLHYNGSGGGSIRLNYSNGQPELCYKDGNYCYVESKGIGNGVRSFQRYFYNSGTLDENYFINYDFKRILKKGADELLIFGETAGQAIMKIFYKNGGNYFQPIILNPGAFIEAFRKDDNNYLIVQSQGVYLYSYSTTNLITKINESNILSAAYDDLNDRIYLGFANMVKLYTSEGMFIKNIPISGNIINLKVHYNK